MEANIEVANILLSHVKYTRTWDDPNATLAAAVALIALELKRYNDRKESEVRAGADMPMP